MIPRICNKKNSYNYGIRQRNAQLDLKPIAAESLLSQSVRDTHGCIGFHKAEKGWSQNRSSKIRAIPKMTRFLHCPKVVPR